MKKIFFSTLLLSSFFSLPANAVHYFSGQKEYLNHCRSCHGSSLYFVSQYTMERWAQLLDKNAAALYDIHVKTKDSQEVEEYLKGTVFQNKLIYIKAFTEKFAKDGEKNQANKK